MSRETAKYRALRAQVILERLHLTYPEAHCELEYSNPLELLIATILSAQCSDRQVNIVTRDLFQSYKTPSDYAQSDPASLENDLRRIGLYRNKSRHIQSCCRQIIALHNGIVPNTIEALMALDGVGRKTANVVLGNAFNIVSGIVVDTHVARLAQRLGLTHESQPVAIEQALQQLFPESEWIWISHGLIWHGRRRCKARNPDCTGCELNDVCPSSTATH